MNIWNDFGDMLSGGKLATERIQLPYSIPLSPVSSISNEKRILAVQERAFSWTGEDFDILDITTTSKESFFAKVRGAMLHLPGKDKMRIACASSGGEEVVAILDRKLVAMTPTYDIYRVVRDDNNGKQQQEEVKMAWIEKEVVAFRDTFDVFLEGSGGMLGPFFKPPPALKIEGDFFGGEFNLFGEYQEKIRSSLGRQTRRCRRTITR